MAQQRLDVQELTGQDRNRVHGQSVDGVLVPQRVYNLTPDRGRGYTPYGRRTLLLDLHAGVPRITNLLSFDETGISSFRTTEGVADGLLSLYRGATTFTQQKPSYGPLAFEAVHIDTAGAYLSRDAFLVLDRDDRPMEPMTVSVTAAADVLPATDVQQITGSGNWVDVEFGNDVFVAVTDAGYIYRSSDGGTTWDTDFYEAGVEFRTVVFGNGTWIASAVSGVAYRSVNDGETWELAIIASEYVEAVTWAGGDTFMAAGNKIWRSLDAGQNWSAEDNLSGSITPFLGRAWNIARIGVLRLAGWMTGPAIEQTNGSPPANVFFSWDGGTSFDFRYTIGGTSGVVLYPVVANSGTTWTESNQRDTFVAVNYTTSQVYRKVAPDPLSLITNWETTETLDGRPRKVKWNPIRNTWFAVGHTADNKPAIWSSSNGSNWSRLTAIEESIEELGDFGVYSVAFDNLGTAVYVGASGAIAISGAQKGLRRGTYNIYVLAYFNARAGRFVFYLDRQTLTMAQEFGNLILFSAMSKGAIAIANPGVPADVIDDLRFDVYVQFVPTDNPPEAETAIRYAFTDPFPGGDDDTVPLERDLDALPIGRQLGSRGLATTAVFEKSRTALHGGRIWGMANQGEERWASADGISLEIANQSNAFVLSYTEIGWANLMMDQSFIPIQPTQSTNFTGILSTPSGLMVMFDNEIYLISGDPAFGNVQVDLYLDMVGCDVGTFPCKVGGMPFTVWGGKIWMLQAGQATEISRGQWLRSDPFVRIAPEPQTRSILALTQSGAVFRYLLDDQFWLTDAVSRDDEPVIELLPNCNCVTGDNTRFVQATGLIHTTRRDGTPDTPHLIYRDIDFGFPDRRTPLYVVKGNFEGEVIGLQYDRDHPSYDAAGLPALFFDAAQEGNGAIMTLAELAGGIAPYLDQPGLRRVAALSWRLPLRSTRGFALDVRIELRGMAYPDTMKPPLRLTFAAGGELR